MSKVIVIGGGASGLVSAIYASKNNEVTIIEKNDICGKKILVTGNGRCNYYNAFQDLKHYNESARSFLKNIITIENQQEVLSFFESIGIIPRIKNGYFYPYSNQASSIREALVKEAKNRNIKFINNLIVKEIKKDDNYFHINPKEENIICDKVILAMGSYAGVKDKDGITGYDIAKSFGHSVKKVLPSLVQLRGEGNYFNKWNGVRTEAKLTLYEDDILIKEEQGEVQLTDYGISGICTFNLSSIVSRGLDLNKKESIVINFLPFLNFETRKEYLNWFENRNLLVKNRTINELLEGLLNYKLVQVLLNSAHIKNNLKYDQLSNEEKNNLLTALISFKINIIGTNSYEKAQVCSGGISVDEVNYQTFESKKCKDLYIIGEMLDVDGECGGYNLSFAWFSGIISGKSCN